MAISKYYDQAGLLYKRTSSTKNEFGEPIYTETSTPFACRLQSDTTRGTAEYAVVDRGEVTISTHALYCAPSVDIAPGDKVVVNSTSYRVLGAVDDGGRGHHQKCWLKEVM